MISEVAPAKLNLALHVRGRRGDGYHEIETLFAFAAQGDVLHLTPAERWSLTIVGPFARGLGAGPDNLVTRAAHAFAARFGGGTDFAVTLDKRLPIAAGIGGGSSDAAALLRILARRAEITLDDPALVATAVALGADVPACLSGRAAIGRGTGAELQPVAGLGGQPTLLVNPGTALATSAVFAAWDGIDRGPLPTGSAAAVAQSGRNDLEPPARALVPVIAEVLAMLAAPGVAVARMSGSGATCFALCQDRAVRDGLQRRIAERHPSWWQLATTID